MPRAWFLVLSGNLGPGDILWEAVLVSLSFLA